MSVFLAAWEQRKLGEVVERRIEKRRQSERYPRLAFASGQGVIPLSERKTNNREQLTKDEFTKKYLVTELDDIVYNPANVKYGAIDRNKYGRGLISPIYVTFTTGEVPGFIERIVKSHDFKQKALRFEEGTVTKRQSVNPEDLVTINILVASQKKEQKKISLFFDNIDTLIALHQRKPFIKNGGIKMITSNFTCDSLFKDYFEFWIKLYKEGAVRPVTLEKYRNNQKHIAKIIPNLKMKDFDRNAYQELLNQYALTHERQTVIDFHHQVKGAILDAVDDGLIDRDPTRKAIFKGKAPREKKQKYLNQFELHNLLEDLDLGMEITWDWLILLIAKTGLRFSEALGLTPADFDFARQTISVNKTWDYKTNTGFQPTKNRSSIRKVQMDWQLGMQFQHLIKNLNEDEPIFVNGPVCNSTPNNCLARHCRKCGIPEISIHGLRHTHASLLMFAGVSIASVSRRLGHSSITTTQKVYMHIISELENQDNDLVMRYLSSLS